MGSSRCPGYLEPTSARKRIEGLCQIRSRSGSTGVRAKQRRVTGVARGRWEWSASVVSRHELRRNSQATTPPTSRSSSGTPRNSPSASSQSSPTAALKLDAKWTYHEERMAWGWAVREARSDPTGPHERGRAMTRCASTLRQDAVDSAWPHCSPRAATRLARVASRLGRADT